MPNFCVCVCVCVCVSFEGREQGGRGGKGEEGRTLNFSLIGFSPMVLSCCLCCSGSGGGGGGVCVL
jgi:hypothetical protein